MMITLLAAADAWLQRGGRAADPWGSKWRQGRAASLGNDKACSVTPIQKGIGEGLFGYANPEGDWHKGIGAITPIQKGIGRRGLERLRQSRRGLERLRQSRRGLAEWDWRGSNPLLDWCNRTSPQGICMAGICPWFWRPWFCWPRSPNEPSILSNFLITKLAPNLFNSCCSQTSSGLGFM
jgi:hypothetical protein